MTLDTGFQVFLVGLAGGLALELMHWYAIYRDDRLPAYANSTLYWTVTALMAAAGGGMALLYFGGRADGLLAFHVGASTPLILQKLTTTAARQTGAKSLQPSLLSFFRW